MIIYTLLAEAGQEVRGRPNPCTATIPGLQWRVDNLVVSNEHRQALPATGMQVRAVYQLAFEQLAALRAFAASDSASEWLAQLRAAGFGALPMLVLQNEVLARPSKSAAGRLLKRMGILRRDAQHSPEAFRKWWLDVHGPVAAGIPELRGYMQNLVYDRLGDPPAAADGRRMECDGITELWFDDAETMERAFPPRTGTSVTQHANRYIEAISTLIVREEIWP